MMNDFRKFLLIIFIGAFMTESTFAKDEHQKSECKEALLKTIKGTAPAKTRNCKVTSKLTMWITLQGGAGNYSFEEITSFIKANPNWPNQSVLKRSAEEAITAQTPAQILVVWFQENSPRTTNGVMAYGNALKNLNKSKELKEFIKTAWVEKTFSKTKQKEFLKNFGHLLTQADHVHRLERLLWANETEQTQRLMPLIGSDHKKLAEARLAFKAGKKSGVPKKFENHEGSLYDQARSLRKQGRYDEATSLIHKANHSPENAANWWQECHYIAREFIENKRYKDAFNLITKHKLTSGEGFATAEWTAGWLSLRFLNDPTTALKHFKNLYKNVKSPISLSRAAYWLGRSYETLGKNQEAADWYKKASEYRTTYYGQLSAAKLKLAPYPELSHHDTTTSNPEVLEHELAQALNLLAVIGKPAHQWTRPFAIKLAKEFEHDHDKHTLVSFVSEILPHETVWVTRTAGSEKHLEIRQGYPHLKGLPKGAGLPEQALSHSIAYQESRFDPYAISSAGAMGLMQMMPQTAQITAKKIGVKHQKSQLTSDPKHNVMLGSHHLGHMLERFDNSYILAIAAYNAGHTPVERWLTTFGDPRTGEIDIVDWVELIPYKETRNYVQRVLENIGPYRSLLDGGVKETIIEDLQRHSKVKSESPQT